MNRVKYLPVTLLLVAAFGLLALSIRHSTIADQSDGGLTTISTAKPSHAPDWTLPDVRTGHSVNLQAQARQRPVVFSFWATYCGPCRLELPHLERVSQRYRGRVQFYGVNGSDAPPAIKAFAAQLGLSFPMLADTKAEASTRYGVDTIPLLVVVDTKGNIRAVSNGYDPSENIEAGLSTLLDKLLAEQRNPTG